jgi:hypothetical protein
VLRRCQGFCQNPSEPRPAVPLMQRARVPGCQIPRTRRQLNQRTIRAHRGFCMQGARHFLGYFDGHTNAGSLRLTAPQQLGSFCRSLNHVQVKLYSALMLAFGSWPRRRELCRQLKALEASRVPTTDPTRTSARSGEQPLPDARSRTGFSRLRCGARLTTSLMIFARDGTLKGEADYQCEGFVPVP